MQAAAAEYVRLVLALGRHDPDFVDAYYGPPEAKAEAEREDRPLARIRSDAAALALRVASLPAAAEEIDELRRRFLARQVAALATRAEIVSGRRLPFDEESLALYDAVAPAHGEDHFRLLRSRLEAELPGTGALAARCFEFRTGFAIPPERVDRVFRAAIDAARERTSRRIALPPEESFVVEYVRDKPWSGYNWYQGGFRSLIQVNLDLPILVERAIDLACHEGYPGHHVHNVLLEKRLARDRGWIEFEVYPLFSPESLIAEGSANFGIEVAFPGPERLAFERGVVYPLAGLDPARAESYERVRALTEGLSHAGNEAARRYLDGAIDAAAAEEWLVEYALLSPAQAAQRVRFIERYRSYVVNYHLGKDLVRAWIEARGGTADRPARRWELFESLLAAPRLPSDLG
jgi:quinol monooxygenase YgiN